MWLNYPEDFKNDMNLFKEIKAWLEQLIKEAKISGEVTIKPAQQVLFNLCRINAPLEDKEVIEKLSVNFI